MTTAYKTGVSVSDITWTETTSEKYWEMLGVLPPAAMKAGGFLVGEPVDHDHWGQPRFEGYKEAGGKFFVSSRQMTHREFCAIFGATSFDYVC